ncbi:MAG: mechanosensitive ion channel [Leptospirales bacterium]|nr:mechanosensitive ion channel [Leptospirales bacterium]
MHPLNEVLEAARSALNRLSQQIPEFLPLLVYSAVVLALVALLRFVGLRLLRRHYRGDRLELQSWRNTSFYVALLLSFAMLIPAWLSSLEGLLTIIGLFGAGVLIVLKEVILNGAGWFYILVRRPFNVGHRVAIGNYIGDVLDIRLLGFTMIEVLPRESGGQSTGRVVHVPNALLFSTPLSNASKEFSFNWNEINAPLTLDSDWQRAAQILQRVAEESIEQVSQEDRRIRSSEEEYAIHYNALSPSVFVDYHDGAIRLSLRHLTEPRKTRLIVDRIWREFLLRLASEPRIQLRGDRAGW